MNGKVISASALGLLTLLAIFHPTAFAVSDGVAVDFYTEPREPYNFQPFLHKNQPAKVVVGVKDSNGNMVKNVNMQMSIEHVKGFASGEVFNTGFPYLEGKKVFGGEFFSKEGRLEFSYVFPIRGSYKVSVAVSPSEASPMMFEPFSKEFNVVVKEWGYQIRNAAILLLIMLGFGMFLGNLFARASMR